MKKFQLFLMSLLLCLFSACHSDIWDAIDDLDVRLTQLEEYCRQMNTNIDALKSMVEVLQNNDYITGIVEVKKDGKVVGYTITFAHRDSVTIYHGEDGANGKDGVDGTNGKDGADAVAPVIGVAQDTDGLYYWTLNGEWLLDDAGQKLPVTGPAGADGNDGATGSAGADGVTPKLKIEDGYWYVSYDNEVTWVQLDVATGAMKGDQGEKGDKGDPGEKGEKGDAGETMFQSVTQDDDYVYFTLADGTVIQIAKGGAASNDNQNTGFIFYVTYDANGGVGTMDVDTFYYSYENEIAACAFIREGYRFVNWNTSADGSGVPFAAGYALKLDRNMKLYAQWQEVGLVDLGLSVKWAGCNIGADTPEAFGDYFAWGEVQPKKEYSAATYIFSSGNDYTTISKYNTTDKLTQLSVEDDAAVVNWGGNWRMPTHAEWNELKSKCTWTRTTLNSVGGYQVTAPNGNSIFLPYAGHKNDQGLQYAGMAGYYWTSTLASESVYKAQYWYLRKTSIEKYSYDREWGLTIRPVCE